MDPAMMAGRAASKFRAPAGGDSMAPGPMGEAAETGEDPKTQVASDVLAAFEAKDPAALSAALTEFYEYCKPSEM